ncbi:phosphoglycerate mutase [Caballeronia mineralivorans PML1(12)]|uniref:Phosphoglycerate mutase n=1 Tax=Caballeronia mineralivorans PML1(12) TaxID=908627 RepID=A0A0J1CSY6_9BURK|nr:histidine phosphatase family protein [Caballeronia mineralivorans]KLU23724.1 phosphoglycerate mutase [Caballeronia mineralivorans PML1(12)]
MNTTATENHANQPEIWLIRHGETEWSLSGQHTGRTDIPLTDHGRAQARTLRPVLAAQPFDLVLRSPMSRARDTCAEAGLGGQAEEEPRLSEWDYGIYEGRKTKDIRAEDPDWSVWTSPIPQGESVEEIQARAESLIQRLLATNGRIALFSHAHFLRVLGGCWMADSAVLGAHLLLDTASVSVLGFDRETRALKQWNVCYPQS